MSHVRQFWIHGSPAKVQAAVGGYQATLSTLRVRRKVFSYKMRTGWKAKIRIIILFFFFTLIYESWFPKKQNVQKVVERALGLL